MVALRLRPVLILLRFHHPSPSSPQFQTSFEISTSTSTGLPLSPPNSHSPPGNPFFPRPHPSSSSSPLLLSHSRSCLNLVNLVDLSHPITFLLQDSARLLVFSFATTTRSITTSKRRSRPPTALLHPPDHRSRSLPLPPPGSKPLPQIPVKSTICYR